MESSSPLHSNYSYSSCPSWCSTFTKVVMKFQVGEEVIRTVKPEDTGRREIIGFSGIIIENFAHYALIKILVVEY